jgi:hypothetical protein
MLLRTMAQQSSKYAAHNSRSQTALHVTLYHARSILGERSQHGANVMQQMQNGLKARIKKPTCTNATQQVQKEKAVLRARASIRCRRAKPSSRGCGTLGVSISMGELALNTATYRTWSIGRLPMAEGNVPASWLAVRDLKHCKRWRHYYGTSASVKTHIAPSTNEAQ